jgi:DNA-binding transcriptional regulator/RsmH inhibitor MraZ
LVHLFGFRDQLSLDERRRFRLPDQAVAMLHQQLGKVRQEAGALDLTPGDPRLGFYMVPGTRERIFLYPVPNIRLAIESVENPPLAMDPDLVRRARDYFYERMHYAETDKQHRLAIPSELQQHAGIDESVQQVTLVAQNHWLTLARSGLMAERARENLEAFTQAAPDLLDPVHRPVGRARDGQPEDPR